MRKLLADLVETRLQQTITDQPEAYRRSVTVDVRFAREVDSADLPENPAFPDVLVRLVQPDGSVAPG